MQRKKWILQLASKDFDTVINMLKKKLEENMDRSNERMWNFLKDWNPFKKYHSKTEKYSIWN